jgi:hypothetical protein
LEAVAIVEKLFGRASRSIENHSWVGVSLLRDERNKSSREARGIVESRFCEKCRGGRTQGRQSLGFHGG